MLIEAKELKLALEGRPVLDGIDLSMERGSIYGLLGPNGAGKTTTITVLTGLRKALSGTVRVLGLDPARQTTELRRVIGVLPEQFGLYDRMLAEEYLGWFAGLYGLSLARDEAAKSLAQVGLRLTRQPIGQYSRGMKQRLGLARALLNRPKLLILDEPTSGLDPRGRREIHDVLLELAHGGVGILLSTHLLDDVDRLCTDIGIIHRGHTVLEGNLAQLLAARRATSRYRLRLISPPAETPALLPPGIKVVTREGQWLSLDIPAGQTPAEVWRRLFELGWNILEIHEEGRALEDLYLAATEKSEAA